jgi:hypothetical protein
MFKYAMLLAGVVSVVSGGPAAAITMKATYTGTVFASSNDGALFGGSTLNGATAIIEFVYDPSLPGALTTSTSTYDLVRGGSAFPATNPILSSSIKINGSTEFLNGSYYGQAQNTQGSKSSLLYQNNTTAEYGGVLSALLMFKSNYIPYSLEAPVPYTVLTGNADVLLALGGFFLVEPLCSGNTLGSCKPLAAGSVLLTSFEIVTMETPLPAALPLFGTVLAGGGLIAWRRKRKQLRAAA